MARTATVKKSAATKPIVSLKEVEEFLQNKKQCNNCGSILDTARNFYVSYSKVNKYNQRMSICKNCLNGLIVDYIEECQDIKIAIYKTCRIVGSYFTEDLFNQAYGTVGYNANLGLVENGLEVWKEYIKNINSLKQNIGKSFDNGIQLDLNDADNAEDNTKIMSDLDVEKELEFY